MRNVKDVDIYVDATLALQGISLNYEDFDMESEEPQVVTATAFFPKEERYTEDHELVIDFKDGIYAKAKIFACDRLVDEYLCDMRFIDAAYSLSELT